MTLTEFLLARIAEDEAMVADEPGHTGGKRPWALYAQLDAGIGVDPRRVLADCEAKRQAVECAWGDHLQIESEWGSCQGRRALEAANDYPGVIQWLASVYADHPDYREEWRP